MDELEAEIRKIDITRDLTREEMQAIKAKKLTTRVDFWMAQDRIRRERLARGDPRAEHEISALAKITDYIDGRN